MQENIEVSEKIAQLKPMLKEVEINYNDKHF